MRWKLSKDPEIGDTRKSIGFAFLPVEARNADENNQEYLIWLSFYHRTQTYMKWTSLAPGMAGSKVIGWRTTDRVIYNTVPKKW